MFGLFGGKKEVNRVREEVKNSFDLVKKDISGVGEWINHLHLEKENHKKEISDLKEILSSIKKEMEEVKELISEVDSQKNNDFMKVFKTPKRVFKKQTAVYAVQTPVQTGVQTPKLEQFSITERAILWVLLNTDLKLSYEDIGALLGKERTTIRGQINSIKQKSESIIHEITEKNNKKRVFIPEDIREKLLKKSKVRVKSSKNSKKKRKR
tara:strand:+ start:99 stop:728 length:630 start_codon:yes stop_codon:yes gene_type:complete